MKTETNPTLLEIACRANHWSAYLAVDGEFDSYELAVTDTVYKLMQMQDSGFSESYRGDLYHSDGYLMGENVLVEIESTAGSSDALPTILVGNSVIRTQDFREITSDTLTGPGGWYVIIRSTEEGEW